MNLKTRVSLLAATLVIAGIWGFALRASAVLQVDIEKLLADQLSATVGYIASDIDRKIELHFALLQEIADRVTPDMLADPASINRLLEQRDVSSAFFPTGMFVLNKAGIGIAQYPQLPGRVGGSLADRDWFIRVMAKNTQTLGSPVIARFSKQPLVPVAVPIRDASGAAAAALVSSFYPSDRNLFGLLDAANIGKDGYFLVAAPKERVWVAASDPSRIMQPLPARGLNATFDRRFEQGFEGAMILTSTKGVEILSVGRTMKTTGWMVIAAVPTTQAFVPVFALKQQIYLVALLLSLLVAGLLRWMLVRQLTPLEEAAVAMQRMSEGAQPFAPLPIRREDEIGRLLSHFNRLVVERMRAGEEQLRFRAAIDVSADLFLLIDPVSMRYVDVNETACRVLGYSRAELLALGPQDLFSGTREELAESYDRLIAGDLSKNSAEGWYRRKDGSRLWVESVRRAVPSQKGHVIVAVARDIGERRRAEQLRTLEHAVTRSLATADSPAQALKVAMRAICETENWECGRYFQVDEKQGVMRLCEAWSVPNEAVERYVSASRDLVYTPGLGLLGRVWQSGTALWVSDIFSDARVSQSALARDCGIHGAFVFPVMSEGKIIGVFAFNSREVRESEEQLVQAISVIGSQIGQFLVRKHDEGELRRLNAQLERRVAERTAELEKTVGELNAAIEEMDAFTYSVAHDLRAPLRAMNAFSELLIADYRAAIPEEGQRYLQRAASNAKGMAQLIDDLLVFSRYARQPLEKQRVDMASLAREVADAELPANGGAKVSLQIEPLPPAEADRSLLRVVLVNLISNAVKYSRKAAAPAIRIGYADGAYFVRDNGTGFDMAHTAKLFGVFQRLHRKEDFEGTGVGLAIVKRVIERHGGRVWAQAEPGKGATFFFTLP